MTETDIADIQSQLSNQASTGGIAQACHMVTGMTAGGKTADMTAGSMKADMAAGMTAGMIAGMTPGGMIADVTAGMTAGMVADMTAGGMKADMTADMIADMTAGMTEQEVIVGNPALLTDTLIMIASGIEVLRQKLTVETDAETMTMEAEIRTGLLRHLTMLSSSQAMTAWALQSD